MFYGQETQVPHVMRINLITVRRRLEVMRDPHVETLYYTISSHEGISYKDPEPIHLSNHLAQFDLADGRLAVRPAEHFADEATARQAVGPYLTSWEMDADLTSNIGTIRFQFERSEIIDRNPPKPGEPVTIQIQGVCIGISGLKATLHIRRGPRQGPHDRLRENLAGMGGW